MFRTKNTDDRVSILCFFTEMCYAYGKLGPSEACLALLQREYPKGMEKGSSMNCKENDQFFSVSNGLYYVKRTTEDVFYVLTEENEWKYNPSLADEFYDVLSGYVEITEEAMDEIIRK